MESTGIAQKAAHDVLDMLPGEMDTDELFEIQQFSQDSAVSPRQSSIQEYDLALEGLSESTTRRKNDERQMIMDMMMAEDYGNMGMQPGTTAKPRGRIGDRTTGTSRRSLSDSTRGTRRTTRSRQPSQTSFNIAEPLQQLATQKTFLFILSVTLPQNVKPAAEEFMHAVLENLQDTLDTVFDRYKGRLEDRLRLAISRLGDAGDYLSGFAESGAGRDIDEQLSKIVDISSLSSETLFSEAIDILKNSVDPPLQIVVLWKELLDEAEIEPTTPIDMDEPSKVRLGKGLEVLLQSVGSVWELAYDVDSGIVTVATCQKIEVIQIGRDQSQQADQDISIETDPDILAERRQNILADEPYLELDIARLKARQSAIENQIAVTEKQVADKVGSDTVTTELQRILKSQTNQLENLKKLYDSGRASTADIADAEEKLARARIELAQRREEMVKSAGGLYISKLNSDLADIALELAEKQAEFQLMSNQLEQIQRQLMTTTRFDARSLEISRAKREFEFAQRQVDKLQVRLMSLVPPTVDYLGAP